MAGADGTGAAEGMADTGLDAAGAAGEAGVEGLFKTALSICRSGDAAGGVADLAGLFAGFTYWNLYRCKYHWNCRAVILSAA